MDEVAGQDERQILLQSTHAPHYIQCAHPRQRLFSQGETWVAAGAYNLDIPTTCRACRRHKKVVENDSGFSEWQ